jgi:hypothetical protein
MYEIIGTDRRYGMKQTYGCFRSLRDCLVYMESLKRSFGSIIKFSVEVMSH